MSTPHDERILVTGGSSGIGDAIVARAQARGWDAVVIDRVQSSRAPTFVADLSDRDLTTDALRAAVADGPITRLVNNVGAVFPAALEDQTLDEMEASFAVNLRSAVQCTQALLPGMRQAHFGRIVNISSRAALGKEQRTAYAAAKAGLLGLTRVWALELGRFGVTVNAVGPGPIATDLFLRANPVGSPQTTAIVSSVPVGRVGEPDEVAFAVEHFLDDRAGFTTGQTLYVCGGLTVGSVAM